MSKEEITPYQHCEMALYALSQYTDPDIKDLHNTLHAHLKGLWDNQAKLELAWGAIEEQHTKLTLENEDLKEKLSASDLAWGAIEGQHVDIETKLYALRDKVKSSPKVWIWWRLDDKGKWFIKRATENKSHWGGSTIIDIDRMEEVYAVPVADLEGV
jgi:regulator of replication initiation timing